ncbi:MAG TPA: site-2 protease family protein [Candidatus Dormibacteraeota bacterium]|nr:site-2 protease family protein [Candidatus Dormibacteraeota bacterium]
MQDPGQLPQQPTHYSPDGRWYWDGANWTPTYSADIPAQSSVHYSSAPSRRTSGGIGAGIVAALAAAWAYGKYALLFLFKFKAFGTLLSLLVSFGGYAVFWGPWFAGALVVMILIHEMGHVLEIRRQGMAATAPIFIPFFGAAIFQRSHPTDALKQAQIGIAGPIAGTIGATAAFFLYLSTHWEVLLLAAYLGFFINLFNLIPAGFLDGGWILAPVSKWFQVAGYALIAAAVIFGIINPLGIIIALLGIPTLVQRFRDSNNPYYTSVPVQGRVAMGAAWLALVIFLGVMSVQADTLLGPLVR